MRTISIIILIFILISCSGSDDNNFRNPDQRNEVVGTYTGIRIVSGWTGEPGPNFWYDTFSTGINITKSKDKSTVLFYNGIDSFLFTYENYTFRSLPIYHPPTLRISNDTIFFHHQPALGPYWIDCIAKKD